MGGTATRAHAASLAARVVHDCSRIIYHLDRTGIAHFFTPLARNARILVHFGSDELEIDLSGGCEFGHLARGSPCLRYRIGNVFWSLRETSHVNALHFRFLWHQPEMRFREKAVLVDFQSQDLGDLLSVLGR